MRSFLPLGIKSVIKQEIMLRRLSLRKDSHLFISGQTHDRAAGGFILFDVGELIDVTVRVDYTR